MLDLKGEMKASSTAVDSKDIFLVINRSNRKKKHILEIIDIRYFNNGFAMQKSSFPSAGTQRGLMILADFKYMKHKVPAVKFHDIMNMRNYNNTGFFKEFYLENSYGQFYITADIVK